MTSATEGLIRATVALSDADLERPYDWRGYDEEGLRFALLVAHRELRELAVRLGAEEARAGPVRTEAQRILGQLRVVHRDTLGIIAGMRDADLDRAPASGGWPLRDVIDHIVGVERSFLATILLALDADRVGR